MMVVTSDDGDYDGGDGRFNQLVLFLYSYMVIILSQIIGN